MHIVRRVLPHEYGKYREHLLALDRESRILRFASNLDDNAINSLCDKFEAEPDHHVLFAIEDNDLKFIAVGHIAVFDNMELAFSVLKEHQGQGMGNALMERLIQYCRTHNILNGHLVCLPHNIAIKRLCKKHGIRIHAEYGEVVGDISLDQPDIISYINEVTSSSIGMFDYLSKRSLRPWTFTV